MPRYPRSLAAGFLILLLGSVPCPAGSGQADPETGAADLPDPTTRDTSYSIGYQVGGDFRGQGVSIQPEILIQGLLDALARAEPRMTEGEMRQALTELQRRVERQEARRSMELARRNLEEASEFLAANGDRPGVRALPSGLQYQVLQDGNGRSPGPDDTVVVHYRGTLSDGAEFESSRGREEPVRLRLGSMPPGWQEALPLMREGARWELFLPPELGYGSAGSDRIEPNRVLIYDVELLAVEPAPRR